MDVSDGALRAGTPQMVVFGSKAPAFAAVVGFRSGTTALVVALAVAILVALVWAVFHTRRSHADEPAPPDVRGQNPSEPNLIDRRTALRVFGVSALALGPLGVIPKMLERLLGPSGLPVALQQDTGPDLRVRQWVMIIDMRFCDGCQSQGTAPQCTLGCIEGHLAPEPMEWIQVFEDELPGNGTRFLPVPCQHCQNPPCVNVCPVGATFSTPEGLVLIDQDRCIGCRICMAACPYDRRYFNWGDPPVPPEALLAEYDVELQVPAVKGTVMKCDLCPDMIRANTLPYCVQACPNDAIYYGDLEEDVATNGSSVVAISHFLANRDAFRLKEELGTQPRVFYLPGHGEGIGRDPTKTGRLPTKWPWIERVKGAVSWTR
ncbi:MAG: 4Fe-4S dicluster domain-containing protein [Acidimicrobiia bacterium]